MSVTLEPVQQEAELAEEAVAEPEAVAEVEEVVEEAVPETVEEAVPEAVEEAVPEPVAEAVQEPQKRGRPKAAPNVVKAKAVPKVTPKAVNMKPPSESSDDDDKLTHDDMGTLLLDYLVKRNTSQQNARRMMWYQLSGLS